MHQLRLLAEIVVYKLYEAHLDDEMRERHSLDDIHGMFSVSVSKKLLDSCINYMRRDREPALILRSGTAGKYSFRISGEGILFAEHQLMNKDSLLSYYAAHGDDRLEDVAGFNAVFHIEDDANILAAWKPIKINKEKPEYRDFVSSIDKCIEAIRGSNEFSNEFPIERDSVLASLEEGRVEIEKENASLNKNKLYRYFLDPLRWIGAALGKGALTAIANETIQKLFELVSAMLQ